MLNTSFCHGNARLLQPKPTIQSLLTVCSALHIFTTGFPSRIRVDQGVENADICLVMEIMRGFGRGSAIRGKSCHNQRIERSWVDVWDGATNVFYTKFNFFESNDMLGMYKLAKILRI